MRHGRAVVATAIGLAMSAALLGAARLGGGAPASAVGATSTAALGGHDHGQNSTSDVPYKGPVEGYRWPDPALPAPPPGRVKHFRVDVFEHVTKVSDETVPMRVWSFGVNGRFERGTGVSPPMVVNQGDKVDITFVNGASKAMGVDLAHSLDLHAAELAPNVAFKTIAPGQREHIQFVASHPGVFLYHCATEPMVMHLGQGMAGMFVVKPKGLPHVDKEYWLLQQEYYPGKPGQDGDYNAMMARNPSVVAFNGYGFQYREWPIRVHTGEKIRVYLANVGPSLSESFHVIGAVFDRTDIEGMMGSSSQAVSLAPAQGGWVDFSLKQKGAYPFVTHDFADMARGAMGAFVTQDVPATAAQGF